MVAMKLAIWLKERGVTQAAFAEMVGTGQSSIARFALDQRIPKKPMMQRITQVTEGEVTSADFYDERAMIHDESALEEAAAE